MPAPDALLLVSTHCPHCPAELATLAELVKRGVIGRLTVINVEAHPEEAAARGVRGVPWLKLARFEFAGMMSQGEIAEWAAKADSETGLADYFHLLLKEGRMADAHAMIEREPETLAGLLPIVANVDASLNVRIGAGALMEAFAGSDALRAIIPRLAELSQHPDARIRADACYYLGLTGAPEARPWLRSRLADDDADVREIAAEALAALGQ